MKSRECGSELELRTLLSGEIAAACQTTAISRHRMLILIASDKRYPIEQISAVFREVGTHNRRGILFGIIIGSDPATNPEGARAPALELGLQIARRHNFVKFEYATFREVNRFLGTTQDFAILDLTSQFNPDDVAIAVESVRGRGFVVLLAPPLEEWPKMPTKYMDQLNVYHEELPPSEFITHFLAKMQRAQNAVIVDVSTNTIWLSDHWIPKNEETSLPPQKLSQPEPTRVQPAAITVEQQSAVNQIKSWLGDVFTRNPQEKHVILLAARGRGKTSAIGLAIGEFLASNVARKTGSKKMHLIITSTDLTQIQPAFKHAYEVLNSAKARCEVKLSQELVGELRCGPGSFSFIPPEELLEKKHVDAIIVDEAGNIPVSTLEKLARLDVPCIWSTTTQGYEGVGRGFALKFVPWLEKRFGESTRVTMEEPIRYGIDDPVEQFLFETFFLNADLAERVPGADTLKKAKFLLVDPRLDAFKPNLPQIFGLLVTAHYKTRPSDFVPIMDLPSWRLWVYQVPGEVVTGTILALPEGGLAPEVATRLATSRKERQGVLVSWVIAMHHQNPHFTSKFKGVRIARIAVHPSLQGQGIGSQMLAALEAELSQGDHQFVATSFGATPELIRFWMKNGYTPIHISLKRAASTGEYSIILIKGLCREATEEVAKFGADFKLKLIDWIRDVLFDAEPEIIAPILLFQNKSFEARLPLIHLSVSESQRLNAYSEDVLKYKAACDVVRKALIAYFFDMTPSRPNVDFKAVLILVAKLQSRSWRTVQKTARMPAPRAYGLARETVKRLAQHYAFLPPSQNE